MGSCGLTREESARSLSRGPGRGGGGPGRGLAAGGALTWARARAGHRRGRRGAGTQAARSRGAQAGPQEALSRPGAPALRGPKQRRRISEEAAAPAGGRGNGGLGRSELGTRARGRGSPGSQGYACPQSGQPPIRALSGGLRRGGAPLPGPLSFSPSCPATLCWSRIDPFFSLKTGSKPQRFLKCPPLRPLPASLWPSLHHLREGIQAPSCLSP